MPARNRKHAEAESTHESCHHRPGSLDDAGRAKMGTRLRRIEGQVRGVQKMIDENRYCPDVLVQISAIQESLRGAAETLLRSHLRHCVTDAIRSRDAARAEEVYAELTDLFRKYAR
jgi:DNA-binding FrmR family transcriptional regulator